jgi:hypothetical protein
MLLHAQSAVDLDEYRLDRIASKTLETYKEIENL